MSKIRKLSPNLIAQIAAGEVVERPASVVKELIENSLDAGASFLTIEITHAGLKKIRVTDDGHGMEKEDLLECFKPHTTSKISQENDLEKILSFGFRGEALSSISAVSRMTIKSKTASDQVGNCLTICERNVAEICSCGMSTGTQITVENLFFNTPARKKFLKTLGTELGHIVNLVTRIALSFPEIGFSLHHNEKNIFTFPPNQTVAERIRLILGEKISEHLIPISFTSPLITFSGFIGKPQIASLVKNKQFLFVNNRLVRNTTISLAIKEAYGTLLENRNHPIFLMSLSLPPENIDINIHPRKEEIKFFKLNHITNLLQEEIKKTLEKENLTYQFGLESLPIYDSYDLSENNLIIRDGNYERGGYTADWLKNTTDLWKVTENIEEESILQIDNLYLITRTPKGLLIVDQHAAHERILFEELLESFEQAKNKIYELPRSIVFNLPLGEAPYLEDKIETFRKLGFDLEPFGNNSFKVNAIPEIFKKRDIAGLIAEVLDDLSHDKKSLSLDRLTERTIAYLACRSAIKAGDYLKPEERKKLLEKLTKRKGNYTCPHGRPVQIEITLNDLHGLFRRK